MQDGPKQSKGSPARPPASSVEDNSFLLDIGGAPAASNPCPNCQQPLRPGSRLCVACGFNLEQGTAAKTRVIRASRSKSSTRAVSSGPSMSPELIGTIAFAVIGFLAVAIPLGIAQSGGDDGSLFTIGVIALRLISLGIVIGAIAVKWEDSIFKAFLAFLFFPYAMYCCVFKSTSPILRGLAASVLLSWVFFFVVYTQRASANTARGGANAANAFVEEGEAEGDPDPSQDQAQPSEYTPPL